MTWHTDRQMLAAYARGELTDTNASSVDAHVLACATCRDLVAELVSPERLERVWSDIVDSVDTPQIGVLERVLVRLGVRGHVARLVVATPSLRMSWLVGVVVTLALAVLVARASGAGDASLFLAVAPLLPLAGVAVAFGPGVDPTYELGVAAPMRGFELLLIRAVAVVSTTIPPAVLAMLALPGVEWADAAWLVPALALSATSLALGTFVTPLRAAATLAGLWIGGVTLSAAGLLAGGSGTAVEFVAFRPLGQVLLATVLVVAVAVLIWRRDKIELRRLA